MGQDTSITQKNNEAWRRVEAAQAKAKSEREARIQASTDSMRRDTPVQSPTIGTLKLGLDFETGQFVKNGLANQILALEAEIIQKAIEVTHATTKVRSLETPEYLERLTAILNAGVENCDENVWRRILVVQAEIDEAQVQVDILEAEITNLSLLRERALEALDTLGEFLFATFPRHYR